MCHNSELGQTFPVIPIMDYKHWNLLAGWKQGTEPLVNFQQIFLTGAETISLSDDFSTCPPTTPQILFLWTVMEACCCTDLRVQVDLLGVLFVTVDVEPDGCSCAACAAETENNSGAVGEDDPETLPEARGGVRRRGINH